MNNEEIISINDKELTKMEMLDQWLKELIYPGNVFDFFLEDSGQGEPGRTERKFSFYTEEHQYFITAVDYPNNEKGYLGCTVTTRKSRPGEGWFRGNELPDGPFTRKTWDLIINAIVSYELVKLSKYQQPDTIPENIS